MRRGAVGCGMRTNEERLASIESTLAHMATKEDIQKLKVWVLTGGGIAGGAGGLITWLVRVFAQPGTQ